MLGVQVVPSALFFLLLFLTLESPRWLMARSRVDERGRSSRRSESTAPGSTRNSRRSSDRSTWSTTRKATFFAQVPQAHPPRRGHCHVQSTLGNQCDSLLRTAQVFEMAGRQRAPLQSVVVGGMNLLFTMLAMTLIDQFGRHKLMIVGSIGYLISLGAPPGPSTPTGPSSRRRAQ